MRVILATLNFPPARGGVEQLCAELARELAAPHTQKRVQLQVIAPAHAADAAFDASLPYPVRRYLVGRLRHVQLARALHAELGAHPDSVVLFGQWTAAGAALASPRVRRARLYALGHAKEFLTPSRGWRASAAFSAYRRATLARLEAVLAVSRYTAEHARAAGARAAHVVHPGVDAARFAAQPAAEPNPGSQPGCVFGALGATAPALRGGAAQTAQSAASPGPQLLTVARLVARKGIDTMIAALPTIAAVHPNVRYRVVGDGPDRPRLLALAAQHGVTQLIALTGAAGPDALPAIYAAADLFILASREDPITADVEGFGLVLLEAQAAGTPVLAATSGGMPDALLPNQTGLLFPPDDPPALARTVLELLADPDRRTAMAHAASSYARARTWAALASEVVAILTA
jgi:phosphatidylinositol alpha-1,6-mannosyltransferase